jgi:hypothetical protein
MDTQQTRRPSMIKCTLSSLVKRKPKGLPQAPSASACLMPLWLLIYLLCPSYRMSGAELDGLCFTHDRNIRLPCFFFVCRTTTMKRDYWIDVTISESLAKGLLGFWIVVFAVLATFCVRQLYHFHAQRRLCAHPISLWTSFPLSSMSSIFESRAILFRGLKAGEWFFLLACSMCVASAALSAFSATIVNHAIRYNQLERIQMLPGRIGMARSIFRTSLTLSEVTNEHTSVRDASVQISDAIWALNRANAPLDQAFDWYPTEGNWH